jgi:hypothetical protein
VKTFEFSSLQRADLLVDAVYRGGPGKDLSADPLNKILPCGTSGGFRYKGKVKPGGLAFVVLYSTLQDLNWPDRLDLETGIFSYYGDNRTPGRELHDTPRNGNEILRFVFEQLHHPNGKSARELVPPFLIFTKTGNGRDVCFRGLAVPGGEGIAPSEDLVALWRSAGGQRFQNYRAYFTMLEVAQVERGWIDSLVRGGRPLEAGCPEPFRIWVESGRYHTLKSTPNSRLRSKEEQLPSDVQGRSVLKVVHSWFSPDPHRFEHFAAKLLRLMDENFVKTDVTRPSRDGGRDAIGEYRVGLVANSIHVTFAMEAKCYAGEHSVGVKETSRLISRLLHRQFGVIVTTSFVGSQAYREIEEDRHPVIVVSGGDIVSILRKVGLTNEREVRKWLESEFPASMI